MNAIVTPARKENPTLVRRRKFWWRSICLSLAGCLLGGFLGFIGMMNTTVKVLEANTNITHQHKAVELNDAMASVRLSPVVTAVLCSLAFVWLVFSIVRYTAVPKTV